ncbi:MAG: DASS family sodium-coupled anion symporter [Methylococcales bacterium]|jgi:solute carrier family 13 (sodium-dependent dicarboxylate transporter), member 2/3/5|nr:DASS family sodium-coupled anion symporter [Methylococcales bacterium]MBT7444222.1 DASS family sodium-coupled anion symporter [Methylococcales bacterium]
MISVASRIGLWLGPCLFILILALPQPEGLSADGMRTLAIATLMATWWLTEAIAIPATALLPIVLFPTLGIMTTPEACAPYAHHLIFLFMGGFFIAKSMEQWNLHKRIALAIIRFTGLGASRLLLGFMLASAFLSMWISNTATTMMMIPIAIAIIKQTQQITHHSESSFATALVLSIAYAASIGGVATLIGTAPNTVLAGIIQNTYGFEITFFDWILFGFPISATMLLLTWWLLTRFIFKLQQDSTSISAEALEQERQALGPMKVAEKSILVIFLLVATAWIIRGFIPFEGMKYIKDSTIAMMGALLLFAIPADRKKGIFLLDWKHAVDIPWGIILLFGGGLALAAGVKDTGLAQWIAGQLDSLQDIPLVLFIFSVALLTTFLTEITSNTATSNMLLPILSSVALAMGIHPFGPMLAACIAASFAFMLPVATPPNAIAFGSGYLTIPHMMRAGIWINFLGAVIVTTFVTWLVPLIWGADLSSVPSWAQ